MAAAPSTRAVWKGAISFGLVHIPIVLYSAVADTRPKFNLIDASTMSPVGNRQVSKTTGEAVQREEIVKGIQVEEGQYVVLTKEEIRSALPKTMQTVEIESFVDAASIPPAYYSKPYHVAPGPRGEKPFALLRQALERTGKAGIARVVISTKQHLAALMPEGDALVLNLLRWAEEVREAPASTAGSPAAPTERELKMAQQLVEDMADAWSPDLFHDEFKEKLQALVEAKARAGDTAALQPLPGEEAPAPQAELLDLTDLLRRSLQTKTAAPAAAPAANRRSRAANDEAPPRRAVAAAKPDAKARASVKPRASAKASPGKKA